MESMSFSPLPLPKMMRGNPKIKMPSNPLRFLIYVCIKLEFIIHLTDRFTQTITRHVIRWFDFDLKHSSSIFSILSIHWLLIAINMNDIMTNGSEMSKHKYFNQIQFHWQFSCANKSNITSYSPDTISSHKFQRKSKNDRTVSNMLTARHALPATGSGQIIINLFQM